jgi:hypothetical protein
MRARAGSEATEPFTARIQKGEKCGYYPKACLNSIKSVREPTRWVGFRISAGYDKGKLNV